MLMYWPFIDEKYKSEYNFTFTKEDRLVNNKRIFVYDFNFIF